ncbi:flavin reductase family protein [Halobacteria archaeon AArc-dxtr1]|nr:flavin reductase family protein [Halobacteria archaeon AArc-dxtr1]
MPTYDANSLSPGEAGHLLSAVVSPRPIAWISTTSAAGVDNLAPFSAYTHVSAEPPIVAVAIGNREDGRPKDTLRNARETGAFAINLVTPSLVEATDATAADLPPEESEFDVAGVERGACDRIDPPRVADAPVTLECVHHDDLAVGDRTLLFGRVVAVHVVDGVLSDGAISHGTISDEASNELIDASELDAVGHLGRTTYARTEELELD